MGGACRERWVGVVGVGLGAVGLEPKPPGGAEAGYGGWCTYQYPPTLRSSAAGAPTCTELELTSQEMDAAASKHRLHLIIMASDPLSLSTKWPQS